MSLQNTAMGINIKPRLVGHKLTLYMKSIYVEALAPVELRKIMNGIDSQDRHCLHWRLSKYSSFGTSIRVS